MAVTYVTNSPSLYISPFCAMLEGMNIGLKRGTVALVPYDSRWVQDYVAEETTLKNIFGDALIDIQHVGSTAIPGMDAKPLIDIAVALPSLDIVDQFIPALVDAGYEHMPERITSDRAFFPKGPRELRTHHLSIMRADSDEWRLHVGFRDYLRAHPLAVQAYNSLKARLAKQHPDDRYAYTAAKSDFIQSVLGRIR